MLTPRITFLGIPPRTQAYYDWLMTGLGMLQEKGQVETEYSGHCWDKLLRCHPKAMNVVRRISPALVDFVSPIDYFCLTGRLEIGGKTMTFAMDIGDSPFGYCPALLETVDLYFKVQHPADFEPEGFPLNRHVRVPYHPDVFVFRSKIRPAMLGRPLGGSVELRRNLPVLRQWETEVPGHKDIRLFASFGSESTPQPRTPDMPLPAPHNYQSEPSLLARWGTRVHHPNLKRSRVVDMLNGFGKPDIHARLWRVQQKQARNAPVPEAEYRSSLVRTMINLNISGFRRSLPYRFMDSFLTGTMVATDTLAVRWYQPFEPCEVCEIGDLGYEKEEDVRWDQVREKLLTLYEKAGGMKDNPKAVLDAYRRKWAPPVFAAHFVKECLQAVEQRR